MNLRNEGVERPFSRVVIHSAPDGNLRTKMKGNVVDSCFLITVQGSPLAKINAKPAEKKSC